MSRLWLPTVVLALLAGSAYAQDGGDAIDPKVQCNKWCGSGDKPCQLIRFLGFSQDGQQSGYSHLTCPGKLEKKKKRMTMHLRRLRKGKRKLATQVLDPEDKIYPGFFRRNDYWVNELPGQEKDGVWEYDAGWGQTIRFYWKTEKKVAYYLEVLHSGQEVYRRRYEFDEIYFDVIPKVYLSRRSQKIALVLALDAIVKVDAGIAFFSLNP
jgi:hypothetical protein